jgi:hypothetical protein
MRIVAIVEDVGVTERIMPVVTLTSGSDATGSAFGNHFKRTSSRVAAFNTSAPTACAVSYETYA